MRKYETVLVTAGEAPEKKHSEIVEKIAEAIRKAEGVVLKIEDWGKKTLAFRVKKQNRGIYTLIEYAGDGDVVSSVERQCKLIENVLIYQSVKLADTVSEEELKAGEKWVRLRRSHKEPQEEEVAPGPYMRPEAPPASAPEENKKGETADEEADSTKTE